MNTQFVIVIEVDNKDAARKYAEGLRGLEAIWDRIMKEAERRDAATEESNAVAIEKYNEEVSAYLKRASLFAPFPRGPNFMGADEVSMRKAERRELEQKLGLAKTAISPFRMAEGDVSLMNCWGDGSRVTELMKEYGLL